jgi:hypothetical protein
METAEAIVNALLESDGKDLAMRAIKGLSPDTTVVFQCPFTDVGHNAPTPHQTLPNYYSEEFGDWQREWAAATRYRLGDSIKNGVIDLNDLPHGTESVIVVNPDGSPGPEYTTDDLDFGTAKVVDTYVSPEEEENERMRDQDAFAQWMDDVRRNQG